LIDFIESKNRRPKFQHEGIVYLFFALHQFPSEGKIKDGGRPKSLEKGSINEQKMPTHTEND
jgi:hypothetical protein